IDELLKDQIKINESVKIWLEEFEQFLLNLPESSQCCINDFSVGKGIKIPISLVPENDKGVFKFFPPTQILSVGAYAFETIHSSSPVINIAVEIPKPCWQGMDNLNYRYHRKRAFYLTYIAHSLLDSDLVNDLRFIYPNDCHIKPDLLITPN
ncbi:nucleolar protein 6-like, partial [Parasteatoda tepidariorum]|uniref:nucleolar protein 6-like n=1 Tax=Parasteatoda tepidariorum TaxID=114398 RepID=UPI001C721937